MRKTYLAALAFMGVTTLSACASDPISPAVVLDGPVNTITVDVSTGNGFVGKGDVQYTLGLNNPQMQTLSTSVAFRINASAVTEVSWECTRVNENNGNETVQERARTTSTSLTALFTTIARERNQFTGFILGGYVGTPTTSSTTSGPAINSCPASPSGFFLSSPAGDPTVVSSSSALEVMTSAHGWTLLLEKPI